MSDLLRGVDVPAALRDLRSRPVNFTDAEVDTSGWHHDVSRRAVAHERPGPPEPGGPWEVACRLVRDYEFSDPVRIRAVYDTRDGLLGRTMLLQGRFGGLRFHMGVRVTTVTDEIRAGHRVWGWAYDTLQGHLERGRMHYEVVKDLRSGAVEFVVSGFSQRCPDLGPLLRAGWWLFGRRTQLRFYRDCGQRLRNLVRDARSGATPPTAVRDGPFVLAPSCFTGGTCPT
ncbi:DUF1990 domain-containing protein [Saccharopolyspora rosea]|uniref:DUF1990 domain-containing protein n=1 Tax=Saccharopolyspora rosea TaxID=524884 RepID=A0ABW3FPK6_9PSEU|nr:DUF1990 domain-containing protein [Saccharopolyspora rosea]